MTQYNNANKKYLDSQLDKLESVTKNGTGVTFRLSSNITIMLMKLIPT